MVKRLRSKRRAQRSVFHKNVFEVGHQACLDYLPENEEMNIFVSRNSVKEQP